MLPTYVLKFMINKNQETAAFTLTTVYKLEPTCTFKYQENNSILSRFAN